MAQPQTGYPVQLSVDYPDRPLARLSSFFRILWLIPIVIIVSAITRTVLTGPLLLMILFKQKYPRWWFDWNLELMRFSNRVNAYGALMSDEYPSTDEEQNVHLDIPYPDAENDLNRWLPLIKWVLLIPHYVVMWVLNIVASIFVFIVWFAILFTGRYPRGLFNFLEGYYRWQLRIMAYGFLLTTDKYPPFSLKP